MGSHVFNNLSSSVNINISFPNQSKKRVAHIQVNCHSKKHIQVNLVTNRMTYIATFQFIELDSPVK